MLKSDKKSIVQLVTPYLIHTGSWLYNQIINIKGFNQYIFTQKKENLNQFFVDNIICIEDFAFYQIIINKFYRKIFDRYGLFYQKFIKDNSIKLFHAHFGFEASRWLSFIKKQGLPLITSFYGLDLSKLGRISLWQKRYHLLFDYGNIFLVEGSYSKQQLTELGCPSDKIKVQRLGVNVESYPLKNYSDKDTNSTIIILQASTFREKKGIEFSLDAIKLLVDEGCKIKFQLIGGWDSMDDKNRIINKIKKLNLENYVEIFGPKPYNETLKYIVNSDIFLHPSVTASDGDNEGGSPVVITEAAAMGIPIVSTFHADIPEVIISNSTGYLVPERDAHQIAEKLFLLIDNIDKRIEFGKNGREYIAKEFNLRRQIEKLEQIYLENIT
jgi:colanic acid/amylovoran biosynthesis glycosyltransferase